MCGCKNCFFHFKNYRKKQFYLIVLGYRFLNGIL
jgi:hypothetical protein